MEVFSDSVSIVAFVDPVGRPVGMKVLTCKASAQMSSAEKVRRKGWISRVDYLIG
jgi:hypothetical protein